MKLNRLTFLAVIMCLICFTAGESQGKKKQLKLCQAKIAELQEIVEFWTSGVYHQPVFDSVDAVERETNVLVSGVEDQWAYIKEFMTILITEINEE